MGVYYARMTLMMIVRFCTFVLGLHVYKLNQVNFPSNLSASTIELVSTKKTASLRSSSVELMNIKDSTSAYTGHVGINKAETNKAETPWWVSSLLCSSTHRAFHSFFFGCNVRVGCQVGCSTTWSPGCGRCFSPRRKPSSRFLSRAAVQASRGGRFTDMLNQSWSGCSFAVTLSHPLNCRASAPLMVWCRLSLFVNSLVAGSVRKAPIIA